MLVEIGVVFQELSKEFETSCGYYQNTSQAAMVREYPITANMNLTS